MITQDVPAHSLYTIKNDGISDKIENLHKKFENLEQDVFDLHLEIKKLFMILSKN